MFWRAIGSGGGGDWDDMGGVGGYDGIGGIRLQSEPYDLSWGKLEGDTAGRYPTVVVDDDTLRA